MVVVSFETDSLAQGLSLTDGGDGGDDRVHKGNVQQRHHASGREEGEDLDPASRRLGHKGWMNQVTSHVPW